MKLVDILARELKEWPEGAAIAVQDDDGEVKFSDDPRACLDVPGRLWIRQGEGECFKAQSGVSEDFRTAIVTRDQWQAAVEALKSPSLHIQQIGRITRQQETIDWSKAPGGATHAAFTGGVDGHHVWYKIGDHGFRYVYSDDLARGGGFKKGVGGPSHGPLINRPLPSESWNGEGLPPVGTACEVNDERSGVWKPVDSVLAHSYIAGREVAVFQIGDYIAYSPADRFRALRTPEQIAAEEREAAIDEMADAVKSAGTQSDDWRDVFGKLHNAGYRKQVQP